MPGGVYVCTSRTNWAENDEAGQKSRSKPKDRKISGLSVGGWTDNRTENWRGRGTSLHSCRRRSSCQVPMRGALFLLDNYLRGKYLGASRRRENPSTGCRFPSCIGSYGRLAQLARALARQARGHWFKSSIAHHLTSAREVTARRRRVKFKF